MARSGAPEGLWLRAERQTAGRGRQGRAWVAPPGNLSASTLVRLRPGDPPAPSLALLASIALYEAIELATGDAPFLSIKWPNDLLYDGTKLSGILLERADDAIVIGFGINLAHHPEDLDRPATSLAASIGHAPDPDMLLSILAETFARWLERWRQYGLAPIRARWLEKAHPIGTALSIHLPDGEQRQGLFDGLDESGALRLRLADGTVHVIHAADVFLIRD